MLTSILNLTSGQQRETAEVSATSFQLQFQQSGVTSQQQSNSRDDFAQQLGQFRQLMQASLSETGKDLPDFSNNQNTAENQFGNKFNQLRQLINKLQQNLQATPLENEIAAGVQASDQVMNSDSLQGLLEAISERIDLLNNFSQHEGHLLTEQQADKLSEALDILQVKLANSNQFIVESQGQPGQLEKMKLEITDLFKDSVKTLEKLSQALISNQSAKTAAKATPTDKGAELLNNGKLTTNSALRSNEAAILSKSVEMDNLAAASVLTKRQEKGDILAVSNNKLAQNTELKTISNSINNLSLEAESEVNLAAEKLGIKGRAILASSENLMMTTKTKAAVTSSVDAKSLFSLSSLVPAAAELSGGAGNAANEMVSSQLLQPNQVTSQSNIQQGLNLRSDFSPNLALRIQWIFQQALSSAEIMMDPPELGPLSVKMQHRGGETNIVFQVNNQQTKEMIEDNLPKLKELLEEQGIALGDTQIKQNQQQEDQEKSDSSPTVNEEDLLESDEIIAKNEDQPSHGVAILDTYI